MFGKPEWFKKKVLGWGLTPVSWQGWVYALVWAGVITGPFTYMIVNEMIVQSIVWLVAGILAITYDVYLILQAMEAEERKKLFFIGEDGDDAKVVTKNFDLEVRE